MFGESACFALSIARLPGEARKDEFWESIAFSISIARFPGVEIGDGLRRAHSQMLAGLNEEELLAILMQLSQITPHDFNLIKKFKGVSLSEKLLKGSQVFDVGG